MDLLKKADFSTETDLKARLFKKLFPGQILSFSGRELLSDDDMESLYAAGAPEAQLDRTEMGTDKLSTPVSVKME